MGFCKLLSETVPDTWNFFGGKVEITRRFSNLKRLVIRIKVEMLVNFSCGLKKKTTVFSGTKPILLVSRECF